MLANAKWATGAVQSGRMIGWTAYVVYRPGQNATVLENHALLPAGGYVMVDVESWQGAIRGDHSAEINQLITALAARVGQSRVWGYGNQSDLASIWPSRPSWVSVVVASYGGSKPTVPNMIGWQYTNGNYSVAGLPSASAPFGSCDHNVLYLDQAAAQGSGTPYTPTTTGGFLMSLTDAEQTRLLAKADLGAVKLDQILSLLGQVKPQTDRLDNIQSKLDSAAWAILGDSNNPGVRSVLATLLQSVRDAQAAIGTLHGTQAASADLTPVLAQLSQIESALTGIPDATRQKFAEKPLTLGGNAA
jgi:hypothetical protein